MATEPLRKMIKRRKGLILAGLFTVTALAVYPQFSVQPVSAPAISPAPAVKPIAIADSRLPMPKGYPSSIIRDPFQMPHDALPPSQTISDSARRTTPSQQAATPQFRLTGVAVGNGTAAAILESSAGSRSYRIGEYAGPYQVRSITTESVILDGPNGSQVLEMRR